MPEQTSQGIGFVIVTHGRLGEELRHVASYIMGGQLGEIAVVEVPFMGEIQQELQPDKPFADRRERIALLLAQAVTQVESGSGVIVFTDILGGTSFNVARQVMTGRQGAVVAGVNLPMLLKAASIRQLPVEQATAELVQRTRNAVVAQPKYED